MLRTVYDYENDCYVTGYVPYCYDFESDDFILWYLRDRKKELAAENEKYNSWISHWISQWSKEHF